MEPEAGSEGARRGGDVWRRRRGNLAARVGSRPGPGAAAGRARPWEAGERTRPPVVPGLASGGLQVGDERDVRGASGPRMGA